MIAGRRLKPECFGRRPLYTIIYLGFVLKQTNDDVLDIVPFLSPSRTLQWSLNFNDQLCFKMNKRT